MSEHGLRLRLNAGLRSLERRPHAHAHTHAHTRARAHTHTLTHILSPLSVNACIHACMCAHVSMYVGDMLHRSAGCILAELLLHRPLFQVLQLQPARLPPSHAHSVRHVACQCDARAAASRLGGGLSGPARARATREDCQNLRCAHRQGTANREGFFYFLGGPRASYCFFLSSVLT